MIVDRLLDLIGLFVDALTALLPSADLPYAEELVSIAAVVNGHMLMFDGVLPSSELLFFYRWVFTVFLPPYLLYVMIRWVWAHVPVLGSK